MNASALWADFGEDDLTLFHKVSVELVQLGVEDSLYRELTHKEKLVLNEAVSWRI